MRTTFVLLGAVLVGLSGCSSMPRSGPSAPPPVSAPAAASPEKVVLENFVGANLADVEHALEGLHLEHEAQAENGKRVLVAGNWTVQAQEPAAGSEINTGSTVTLRVIQPESSPSPSAG